MSWWQTISWHEWIVEWNWGWQLWRNWDSDGRWRNWIWGNRRKSQCRTFWFEFCFDFCFDCCFLTLSFIKTRRSTAYKEILVSNYFLSKITWCEGSDSVSNVFWQLTATGNDFKCCCVPKVISNCDFDGKCNVFLWNAFQSKVVFNYSLLT